MSIRKMLLVMVTAALSVVPVAVAGALEDEVEQVVETADDVTPVPVQTPLWCGWVGPHWVCIP